MYFMLQELSGVIGSYRELLGVIGELLGVIRSYRKLTDDCIGCRYPQYAAKLR